jgi:ribosome-associated protein
MIKKKAVGKAKKGVKKSVKKTARKAVKKIPVLAKKPAVIKKARPKTMKAKTVKVKKTAPQTAHLLPERVEWIIKSLYNRKSEDIRLFDVSQTAGLWEYYVVCSGASSVHVSALRDNLKKEMGEKGFFKSHEDRDPGNKWIVVDFGDILVHIFEKETRKVFALETTLGRTEVPLKGILKG